MYYLKTWFSDSLNIRIWRAAQRQANGKLGKYTNFFNTVKEYNNQKLLTILTELGDILLMC